MPIYNSDHPHDYTPPQHKPVLRPMDELPYNRHDLPNYLRSKLEAAKELYDAGKIGRGELWRCEMDLIHMADTGPIRLREVQNDDRWNGLNE